MIILPATEFCKINSIGQITIPIKIRKENNIKKGDLLEVKIIKIIKPSDSK